MRRLHADLLLVMIAVMWGLGFVFQKWAMNDVGPLTFVAARSVLAAVALAPFALIETRGRPASIGAPFLQVVGLAGFAFFLGALLQQVGLITATVTNSGFLTALYVIFVPFIGWLWYRAMPSAIVWPAAAVSFVGTWLLGGGTIGALSVGDTLVTLSAVFWGAHVVVTAAAAAYDRPLLFTCLQFVVVAVIAGLGAAAFETISIAAVMRAAPNILYVGLISSAVTFTLLVIALRYTPPAEAAVIASTESLFAALAGAVLLGERLGLVAWLGAALIILATLAVQVVPHLQSGRIRPAEGK